MITNDRNRYNFNCSWRLSSITLVARKLTHNFQYLETFSVADILIGDTWVINCKWYVHVHTTLFRTISSISLDDIFKQWYLWRLPILLIFY